MLRICNSLDAIYDLSESFHMNIGKYSGLNIVLTVVIVVDNYIQTFRIKMCYVSN